MEWGELLLRELREVSQCGKGEGEGEGQWTPPSSSYFDFAFAEKQTNGLSNINIVIVSKSILTRLYTFIYHMYVLYIRIVFYF